RAEQEEPGGRRDGREGTWRHQAGKDAGWLRTARRPQHLEGRQRALQVTLHSSRAGAPPRGCPAALPRVGLAGQLDLRAWWSSLRGLARRSAAWPGRGHGADGALGGGAARLGGVHVDADAAARRLLGE